MAKQDVKTVLSGTQKDVMRRYVCHGGGYRGVECPREASTSRNERYGRGRRSYCSKCGAMGHDAHDCKTALQQPQPRFRAGGRDPG